MYRLPPAFLSVAVATGLVAACAAGPGRGSASGTDSKQKDLVEQTADLGTHKTLVAAVRAAGLLGELKHDGPFTLFAPTDLAFRELEGATLHELFSPEGRAHLVDVLTYHVVRGRITAEAAARMGHVETVHGQTLSFQRLGDGVRVDTARMVRADIPCANGVIHIIDRVLLPHYRP